jgi:hypothetical protein
VLDLFLHNCRYTSLHESLAGRSCLLIHHLLIFDALVHQPHQVTEDRRQFKPISVDADYSQTSLLLQLSRLLLDEQ